MTNKDNIASYWVYEILQQTDMTFGELIYRVDFIKRNGHGKYLASTNSNRIALAHIADDYGAKLTDGWLSLIHISEPTRQATISYAVFCL